METNVRTTQFLTTALAVSLIALVAVGYYYTTKSHTLLTQTDRFEQRADSLLSAKLQLEGDVRWLNKQLTTAKTENSDLTNDLARVNQHLTDNQTRQRALRQRNTGRTLTIQALNQNLTQLTGTRDSLTAQMNAMHDKIDWQQDSTESLQNQQYALQQKLDVADARFVTMVPRSAVTGDDFRVEATKANDRLTAKAKKVNALTISFAVPAQAGLTGTQAVFLSLTNEHHKPALTPLRTETVALPGVNEVVPVQAMQTVDFTKNPRRISFQLDLADAIKPGLYRASVYTKGGYLGSVEFRFRDSFWFF